MEEDLDSEDARSDASVEITAVIEAVIDEGLCYRCMTSEGEEIFDRSDLMDGGKQQKLVLAFEKRNPPKWDDVCPVCGGEGCEDYGGISSN